MEFDSKESFMTWMRSDSSVLPTRTLNVDGIRHASEIVVLALAVARHFVHD
jgi:hypothetical protein